MTYARFNNLCKTLFTEYWCDPSELRLTPDSKRELTTDVAGAGTELVVSVRVADENQYGMELQQIVNPVTKSVMKITTSDSEHDYFITNLYV